MHGADSCFRDTCDMTSAISSSVPVPPGKRDECVAEFNHFRFALRHILRHNQFCQALQLKFLFDKELWFNADHLPACVQRAFGQFAHQPCL